MSHITGVSQMSQPAASAATDPYVRRKVKYSSRTASYKRKQKKTVKRRYPVRRATPESKAIQIELPDCSQHYIKALYNPFDVDAGVCIPCDLFPLPSQKCKASIRGTFNLSTTGFGFIAMAPSVANDKYSVWYTTTTSVGGASTAINAFTNTVTLPAARLPYTEAQILTNKQVSARVVAAGVRVRYSGKEQDRSGLYSALEEQDHLSLDLETIYQIQSNYSNTYTSRPSGDGNWDACVCYSGPTAPHMLDFINDSYPICSDPAANYPAFIIACQGQAGDLIEFEYSVHVEYIGKVVEHKTMSHADSKTYGKVLETTKAMAAEQPIKPELAESGFSQFVQKVIDSAPKLVSIANSAFGAMQTAGGLLTGNPALAMAGGARMIGGVAPMLLKN